METPDAPKTAAFAVFRMQHERALRCETPDVPIKAKMLFVDAHSTIIGFVTPVAPKSKAFLVFVMRIVAAVRL